MTTTKMLMNTKVLTTIVPNLMTKQTNSIVFTMMVQAATATTTTGTGIGVTSRKWKQQNQYHYQQSPRILQFLRLDPISKIQQRRDRIIYSTQTPITRLRMRTHPAPAFCVTTRYSRPRRCCAGVGVSGTGTGGVGGGCASGAGFFTTRNIWRTFSGTSITCSSRSTGNSSNDVTTTTNNNKNIGVVDQYNPSTRSESDEVVSEDVKSKKEVVLEESSSSSSSSVQEEVVVETQNTKSAIGAAAAAASRQKRKMKIGLAKAVDRGYTNITPYMPAGMHRYYQQHEKNQNQNQTQTQYQLQQQQQNNYETIQSGYKAISGLPKDRTKPFIVLGIETSCDDTGCAIVRSDGTILGEALASQSTIHEPYGGIVPGLARDAHINTINTIISLALQNANITCIGTQIDAIGVTVGPGLEICLRVGTEKAKELAIQYNKPFVGVHHLEAHILMARLPINVPLLPLPPPPPPLSVPLSSPTVSTTNDNNPLLVYTEPTATTHGYYRTMEFPFLALLVSGGHCQLILCRAIGDYTILGGTIDDSLGEVYDKTARLLGLPIGGGSGGPAIEKLAKLHEQYQQEEAEAAAIAAALGDSTSELSTSTVKTPAAKSKRIQFSVPMQSRRNDCDFSFAGLKSNVRRVVMKLLEEQNITEPIQLPERDKAEIAYAFQNVAIQHLEQRLSRAMDIIEKQEQEQEQEQGHDGRIQNTKKIRTLALVGGVAANQQLRKRINDLCTKRSWTMNVPPPRLCTDQGTMSAWAAIERLLVGSSDDPTTQQVYARYPFVSMVDLNTCSTGATLEHNHEK